MAGFTRWDRPKGDIRNVPMTCEANSQEDGYVSSCRQPPTKKPCVSADCCAAHGQKKIRGDIQTAQARAMCTQGFPKLTRKAFSDINRAVPAFRHTSFYHPGLSSNFRIADNTFGTPSMSDSACD